MANEVRGKPKRGRPKKEEPKDKGGRPVLFESPEELEKLIRDFFIDCERRERPPTIAGIAYWLEVDRKTIYNYEKKDRFFHIIKRARDKILANLEEVLLTDGKAGQIFIAKNYGYTDKQELEHSGGVAIKVEWD